ncbi:MAG: tetratricopeptide repeat protein [Candidatus Omnitrophota bacterium]
MAARKYAWAGFLILVIGAVIYSNSFFAEFSFDTISGVRDNPHVHSLGHVWQNFLENSGEARLRVVSFSSFALNYMIHGDQVFGYHLVNFLIHMINVFLVWWLVRGMLCSPAGEKCLRKDRVPYAGFFAALLFLTHPIQTQAVTYIYQRHASLAALFYLLTAGLYIHGRLRERAGRPYVGFYLAAGLSCVLGMFTKQNVFTLPVMLIVMEAALFQSGSRFYLRRKFWLRAAVIAVFLLIIPALQSFRTIDIISSTTRRLSNDHADVTSMVYFFTQWRVLLKYLQLILVPVGQSLDHAMPLSYSPLHFPTAFAGLIMALFLLTGFLLWTRHRLASLAVFWFFITAAVECSFVPIRHVIFEHRMYLPLAGIAMLFAFWLCSWRSLKKAGAVLAVVICVLGLLTYFRNQDWASRVALWKNVIRNAPLQSRGHDNLAAAYQSRGDRASAMIHYQTALLLDPTNKETWTNIGSIYAAQGHHGMALWYFDQALDISPGYADALNNKGALLLKLGRVEEAEDLFRKAIKQYPGRLEPWMNLAEIYQRRRNDTRAVELYRHVLTMYPANIDALRELAAVLLIAGKNQQAQKTAMRLFHRCSDMSCQLNAAGIAAQAGSFRKVYPLYEQLLKQYPESPEIYREVGKFLGNHEQWDAAISIWQQGQALTEDKRGFDVLIQKARMLQAGQ